VSLSEIMSNAGLSRYAEWALLLFVFAFLLVLERVLRPSQRDEYEAQGRLPLEDEATPRHSR
jgi:cbb3-type cytochrome oxidase subunit 3